MEGVWLAIYDRRISARYGVFERPVQQLESRYVQCASGEKLYGIQRTIVEILLLGCHIYINVDL